ncbi:MAG TPA: PadR family transcriptional regulator [Gemmatimonadaceae bacterium]|jgi:transcriptional regulator|nr:MAG: PadR family transcriptional regulator [Gemmatimonadetes bacterium SCN 70-22]HMN10540.1 PadR family transcriptional regulator [Gemmatimonadaceae bacterium]
MALELLQGTLDVLILKALTWGPRHGYAIAQWLRQTTSDEFQVEDGALYTALHRMQQRGLLAGEWGVNEDNRRVKLYSLTTAGRAELRARTTLWTRYAAAVHRVLSAT